MADRGILFSGPMVRALLAGTKTQTRRVFDARPAAYSMRHLDGRWVAHTHSGNSIATEQPRFSVGDRLYVREEYYQVGHWEPVEGARTPGGRQKWAFIADDPTILFAQPANARMGRHHKDPATSAWHKRLGRFMPRAASRITLVVTEVRVERLQACSATDAMSEGVSSTEHWRPKDVQDRPFEEKWWDDATFWANYPQLAYRSLWEAINGPGSWAANPWVTAYTFTVHHQNIDQLGAA